MITLKHSNILAFFYSNNNSPIHLRGLAREVGMGEGPLSRHLKALIKGKVLLSWIDGNQKKFMISPAFIGRIFSFFDAERYANIHFLRKNAVDFYINNLKEKPVLLILFGSTAKGTVKEGSDLDLIAVFNSVADTKEARKKAEAQTGIRISDIRLTLDSFKKEVRMKEDRVVQAALETGFPIWNTNYYYDVMLDGRKDSQEIIGRQEVPPRKDRVLQEQKGPPSGRLKK